MHEECIVFPEVFQKCINAIKVSVFIYLFSFTPLKGEIYTIHTNTRHTTTKMRKLKDAGDCTLQTKA